MPQDFKEKKVETVSAQALVARNIADIESAYSLAETIGTNLWEAVRSGLSSRLEQDGWYVSEVDEEAGRIWFAPPHWLTQEDGETDADPWFVIKGFAGPGGEREYTYLAEFLQVGAEGAGMALWFSSYALEKKRNRQRLIAQDHPELALLQSAGFQIDDQLWIRFPVRLDADAVAQGADDDDYTDALKPLHDAVDAMLANLENFEVLAKSETATEPA